MALSIARQVSDAVDVTTYHKIIKYFVIPQTENSYRIICDLYCYRDVAERVTGYAPLTSDRVTFETSSAPESMEDVYILLKTQLGWETAVNC